MSLPARPCLLDAAGNLTMGRCRTVMLVRDARARVKTIDSNPAPWVMRVWTHSGLASIVLTAGIVTCKAFLAQLGVVDDSDAHAAAWVSK